MKQQSRRYRRYFFTTRVINIWNVLPKDVVNFSTLCSLKNSLNSIDFSRFLTSNVLLIVLCFQQATASALQPASVFM